MIDLMKIRKINCSDRQCGQSEAKNTQQDYFLSAFGIHVVLSQSVEQNTFNSLVETLGEAPRCFLSSTLYVVCCIDDPAASRNQSLP